MEGTARTCIALAVGVPTARPRHEPQRPHHRHALGQRLALLPREQPAEHAVEMAVTRLRRALGPNGIVETVVKRGYRLACHYEPAP